MTLDVKKHRIRIHQKTLKAINNPKRINILVNPELKALLICSCSSDNTDSIRITPSSKRNCEIYGTELIERLFLLNPSLDLNTSYRFLGEICNDGRAIVFDISNALPINPYAFSR